MSGGDNSIKIPASSKFMLVACLAIGAYFYTDCVVHDLVYCGPAPSGFCTNAILALAAPVYRYYALEGGGGLSMTRTSSRREK